MNKEDYYKRIEDKMDKQTGLLIGIKDEEIYYQYLKLLS